MFSAIWFIHTKHVQLTEAPKKNEYLMSIWDIARPVTVAW